MVAGGPQTAAPVRRLGVCGVRGHVGVSGRELGSSGGPSPPRGSPSRHECVSQLLGARGLGSRAQRPWPQDGRECPPPVHPQPLGVSAVPGNAHSLWESPRSRDAQPPSSPLCRRHRPAAWQGEECFTGQAPGGLGSSTVVVPHPRRFISKRAFSICNGRQGPAAEHPRHSAASLEEGPLCRRPCVRKVIKNYLPVKTGNNFKYAELDIFTSWASHLGIICSRCR